MEQSSETKRYVSKKVTRTDTVVSVPTRPLDQQPEMEGATYGSRQPVYL
jgi:hypothetical protein